MPALRPGLLYFAYGCNMDPGFLAGVVGVTLEPGWPACLDGWRLVFNKVGEGEAGWDVVATIEEDAACCVLGVVYRLPQSTLSALDEFEGVPTHYQRATVWLEPLGRRARQAALVYRAQPRWIVDDGTLSPRYLELLIRGARQHGLAEEYISWLQRWARGEIEECYKI